MLESTKQNTTRGNSALSKQRSYNELVEYLDARWSKTHNNEVSYERVKKLHELLGNPAQKLKIILVGGTNGKSLTISFSAKLLRQEGLSVGTLYAPHILTYNERFAINGETISNKLFTEIGNEVIAAAENASIDAHSQELLVVMGLQYFAFQKVDIALLEADKGGLYNPVNICTPAVTAITRVTPEEHELIGTSIETIIEDLLGMVKPGTYLVSADQSKAHLQLMQERAEARGGNWAMPIRKLAPLVYPFEQLHGRCAALAERICQIFAEHYLTNTTIITDSLLTKQKGQRGRPTLEAKRQSELNPKKTLEQFWKEESTDLASRFQLLDKEKPSILLDCASNIDGFTNLLLGIRLLHYQKPIKGLTIIVGSTKGCMSNEKFLKLCRYFFKKTSGQLFLCPINTNLPGVVTGESWDVEQVTNDVKSMKIKARSCKSFEEAFELAKKSVDERHGLVVITGSPAIIHEYWHYKGIKKF